MHEITLLVVGGGLEEDRVVLPLPATLGRGRDATLHLAHPLVSRRHCEILFERGRMIVRDLGSLNGTFIGRERIVESELCPGDLLTIGTVTFRADYVLAAEPDSVDVLESLPGQSGADASADTSIRDDETLRVDKETAPGVPSPHHDAGASAPWTGPAQQPPAKPVSSANPEA